MKTIRTSLFSIPLALMFSVSGVFAQDGGEPPPEAVSTQKIIPPSSEAPANPVQPETTTAQPSSQTPTPAIAPSTVAPKEMAPAPAVVPPPVAPKRAAPAGEQAATPNEIKKEVKKHDGFLIRLALGFGYATSSTSADVGSGKQDLAVKGGAMLVSVALGGAVVENMIIQGEIFGGNLFSTAISIDNKNVDTSSKTSESIFGIGPGLTYYIMPINVYLSASLGIGSLEMEFKGTKFETKTGIATNLKIGKEWWLSNNWGLGLGGQFYFFSVPARSSEETRKKVVWSTLGGGVVFSATKN